MKNKLKKGLTRLKEFILRIGIKVYTWLYNACGFMGYLFTVCGESIIWLVILLIELITND